MWLLRYQKNFEVNGVNPIQTDSTINCLNPKTFDNLVSDCQFDTKLSECDGNIPTSTPKPGANDDGFKTATIVLSITTVLFLGLLILTIYMFKFRNNNYSSGGPLSFSTFAAHDKKVIISS